ncbi:spermatogenesis-associated serine-rich protein 1 [Macrochelys suwanniensis]
MHDIIIFPKELYQTKEITENHRDPDLEWTFYPRFGLHTYHIGKRCVFNGLVLRNKTSASERIIPFHEKEKQQELEKERNDVKNLDRWKPAPTLLQALGATVLAHRIRPRES